MISSDRNKQRRRDLLAAGAGLAWSAYGALSPASADAEKPLQVDLCVYGATAAGIAAAVTMHRLGKSAVIVDPGQHVGGMTASGLGATDIGNALAIGGRSREFYKRVHDYYLHTYGPGSQQVKDCNNGFYFEPGVAERVFRGLLREAGVTVIQGWLRYVRKLGSEITELETHNGRKVRARIYLDASYEGDLMATTGVSYTIGRESNDRYGETINGVQLGRASHNFRPGIDPYVKEGDRTSGLLPGISSEHPGQNGEGDHRVQAYNYRMCLTRVPNRLPLPKPEGYDPERYTLMARYLKTANWDQLQLTTRMPNGKTDTNNLGPVSTDNIGMNYAYPDGAFETRRRIVADHLIYQQGLMWFLANDERVPRQVRGEASAWGLPRDEFVDTGGWPFQLYVREARRMLTDTVITEHHCRGRVVAENSVGLASYNMDSHDVRRLVVNGSVMNEGDVEVGGFPPYPIPYGALLPRPSECTNLLVPVCLAASHIAYGSVRMEPVFMILGQSAATAASVALDQKCRLHSINIRKLQARLHDADQILHWSAAPAGTRAAPTKPQSLRGIVLDDQDGERFGDWVQATRAVERRVGTGYLHDGNMNKGKVWITYTPDLPAAGLFEILVIYVPAPNRATNIPVTVEIEGEEPVRLLLNEQLPGANGYASLGKYRLPAGKRTSVTLSNRDTDGYVVTDGIQFLPVAGR